MLTSEDRASAAQRVVEFITFSDGVDRVTLASDLGLPTPTVIGTVSKLVHDGVIVETTDTVARSIAGRRPRVLRRSGPPSAIGLISWRGEFLEAACHDFSGAVLDSRTLATPDPHSAAPGLTSAIDLIADAARSHDRALIAAVISVPAPFLRGYGSTPHFTARGGDPVPTFSLAVDGDLEDALTRRHGFPVVVENDANLATLGELYWGAGRGCRSAVYVKINDRGFGGGIVVNGALVRGAHGYAGELAHLQLDPDGPLCACGGRGCLRSHLGLLISQTAQAAHDQPVTYGFLARLAADGDAGAARMLTDIGRTLGRPLAHLCTLLDPERVILDDSIGPAVDHILTGLRESMTIQAPPAIAHDLAVTAGTLGPQAETLGAVEVLRERARRG